MKYLKYVTTFLLGAGVGSLVTWKIVYNKVNKEANDRADGEINDMRHYFEMELGKQVTEEVGEALGYSEKETWSNPEVEVGEVKNQKDALDLMNREKEKIAERFNYSNLSKKGNPASVLEKEVNDEDEEQDEEFAEPDDISGEEYDREEEEEVKPEKVKKDPYVIAPNEFDYQFPYDSKETLYYYSENDLLVNEDDEVMDIEETIGGDALRRVGEYLDDVVYVRDPSEEVKYEVIYIKGSYPGAESNEE